MDRLYRVQSVQFRNLARILLFPAWPGRTLVPENGLIFIDISHAYENNSDRYPPARQETNGR